MSVISNRFEKLLTANQCEITKIQQEFEILYEHVKMFLSRKCPHKVWPHLFSRQQELGIKNILHVAEISIAMPTSNAETERIFSFLWRIFSKERQSFKDEGLNDLLRLRTDQNFDAGRYDHAINLFMTEHPNGEIRKHSRRVDGH